LTSAENAAAALAWCSVRASSPVSFSGATDGGHRHLVRTRPDRAGGISLVCLA
jgi:hypothetical protein